MTQTLEILKPLIQGFTPTVQAFLLAAILKHFELADFKKDTKEERRKERRKRRRKQHS